MKIELPVPYDYKTRLIRSTKGREEEEKACAIVEFEIASHSSVDVNLVAEWRQSWKRDGRITAGRDIKPSTGDWSRDFEADYQLARLVLIDGQLYAPLHRVSTFRNKPLTANDIVTVMADENILTESIFGEFHTKLWNWQFGRALRESGFSTTGDEAFVAVPEITRNREIIESGLEASKAQMRTALNNLALVDGIVFNKVVEPSIVVSIEKDTVRLKIAEWKEDAYHDSQFFSLSDFDAASECFLSHRNEKTLTRQVDGARVYFAEVLKSTLEQEEFVRGVANFISGFEDQLHRLPKDVAPFWYELRDIAKNVTPKDDDDKLDKIKEAVHDLTAAINNQAEVSETVEELARLGQSLADRWELRPMAM